MIKEINAWDEYINFISSFMEDESFKDEATAKILNEHFVE